MKDEVWMKAALDWATDRLQPIPAPEEAASIAEQRDAAPIMRSRAAISLARQDWESNDPRLRRRAQWEIANACFGYGRYLGNSADAAAPDWLAVAYHIYSQAGPQFQGSAYAAARLLVTQGVVTDPDAYDPIASLSDAELHDDSAGKEEPTPTDRQDSSSSPRVAGERRLSAIDDDSVEDVPEPGPEGAPDRLLERLAVGWGGAGDIQPVLESFSQFVADRLCTTPRLSAHLQHLVDQDIAYLKRLLETSGIPANPYEIRERALEARRSTTDRIDLVPEGWMRRRCLVASFWNYVLLQTWTTNEPQCVSELVAYVSSIAIKRRYLDSARDFTMATTELLLRLVKPFPALLRSYFLLNRLQSAIGTYMLVGGADPVLPSESQRDPRVEHLSRRRELWGVDLLAKWRSDDAQAGRASLSLATLGQWNKSGVRWVLQLMYRAIEDPENIDHIEHWASRAGDLIDRAGSVYVPNNPWSSTAGVNVGVSSDPFEAITDVSDSDLRAMVAELVDQELTPKVTAQGSIFAGRRTPTYLLVGRYGPLGVLKIDFADRIGREQNHFQLFARRLHARHRPSECDSGELRILGTGDQRPIQAILTSYAFRKNEEPTTLAQWIKTADEAAVPALLEELFLSALYPWVAFVRRETIDIRMEYPILRPRLPTSNSNSPSVSASVDLERLTAQEVTDAIGPSLDCKEKSFGTFWTEVTNHIEQFHELEGLADGLINPLWAVAGIAEVESQELTQRIHGTQNPLASYDTLVSICHGDMHAENILCAVSDPEALPLPIVIDFESAHYGHICKDFARLEASLLCQIFETGARDVRWLFEWIRSCLPDFFHPPAPEAPSPAVGKIVLAISKIRELADACSQRQWPITGEEYKLALLAALLPIVRYRHTTSAPNRATALLLSSLIATDLWTSWTSESQPPIANDEGQESSAVDSGASTAHGSQ